MAAGHSGAVTTEEILDEAEARTGLTRPQLAAMVAKSAVVRHLATHASHAGTFVLKGGTLLSHVYRSPRQSVRDADYTHVDPQALSSSALKKAITGASAGGLTITTKHLRGPGDRSMFKADSTFTIDHIDLRQPDRDDGKLVLTVSAREGEWLDPPAASDPPLIYTDNLLADRQSFEVHGLSLSELASEKVLGWCGKRLPKHLVDLAYVAREFGATIDTDRVAHLVVQKFEVEGAATRYVKNGVHSLADLATSFCDERALATLRSDWNAFAESELLLLPPELNRNPGTSLTNASAVIDLAMDFWLPVLKQLP